MSSEPTSQRFARLVIDSLREAGRATDVEVGAAGGPSTTFMTKLRKVAAGDEDMVRPRNDTMRRIEVAAEWPPGVAARVWEGGDIGTVRAVGLHPAPNLPRDPLLRHWITELLARVEELEARVDLLDSPQSPGLVPAARDVGREGSSAKVRAVQDQAGEPPVDDPDDMTPR